MSPADAAAGYMRVTAEAELRAWEAAGLPDPHLVRQVLHVYGYECGVPYGARVIPAAFRRSLIDACSRADAENRLRLSLGFPELVATVNVIELVQDGVSRLVALLERKADPLDFACEACQDAGTAWTCNRVIQAKPNIHCDGPDPGDPSNANRGE